MFVSATAARMWWVTRPTIQRVKRRCPGSSAISVMPRPRHLAVKLPPQLPVFFLVRALARHRGCGWSTDGRGRGSYQRHRLTTPYDREMWSHGELLGAEWSGQGVLTGPTAFAR